MICPRCQGLMTPVDLYDNHASAQDRWYSTGQCVNCSYIYFPQTEKEAYHVTVKDKHQLFQRIMSSAFPLLA